MEKKEISRRERDKQRQRQEILDAALTLFSDKGYHNVTMYEIAGKAEFAIGTLYKFFKNKEDIYKALVLEMNEELHKSIMQTLEKTDDEVEKLKNYVKTRGDLFHTHLPAIRLYFRETYGESFILMAEIRYEMRKQRDIVQEIIASIFAEGIRKKRFKKIADPYSLAIALDGIITAFLIKAFEAPEGDPYFYDPAVILDILLKELVNP